MLTRHHLYSRRDGAVRQCVRLIETALPDRVRLLLMPLLAIAAANCGDSTGPDLLVSFTVELFDPSSGQLPSVEATAGDGTITVEGGYWVACFGITPSEIEGEAVLDEAGLQLQVGWRGNVAACVPGLADFVYEAVAGNLDAGTYRLQVVHIVGQDVFSALEQDLVVQ